MQEGEVRAEWAGGIFRREGIWGKKREILGGCPGIEKALRIWRKYFRKSLCGIHFGILAEIPLGLEIMFFFFFFGSFTHRHVAVPRTEILPAPQ